MGAKLSHHSGPRAGHAPVSEINVTPLVDVMLVLLIVFMVAAPLMASGVKVDLPTSNAHVLSESRPPVLVSLNRDGHVFIDQTEVSDAELLPRLAQAVAGDLQQRIYLRGDQHLPYGTVIATMGKLNEAGYSKIALISEPPAKS